MELVVLEHGFDFLIRIEGRFRPFRLANLPAYRRASALGFKEMEAGWQLFWQGQKTLALMELKAWEDPNNPNHKLVTFASSDALINYANDDLAKKAIDVLRLLEQNIDAQVGTNISPLHCIPSDIGKHIQQRCPLMFVFVIRTQQVLLLQAIRAHIYQAIQKGLAIHGLNHVIDFNNVLVINDVDFRHYQNSFFVTTRTVV